MGTDTSNDTVEATPEERTGRPVSSVKTTQQTSPLATTVNDVLRAGPQAGPFTGERYSETREIGRGGMGRVAEAQDRKLGRKVAIKHLLASQNSELRRRFDVEALVTALLDHPGIPTVFERDLDAQGQPFYTMRLVQGQTLTALLKKSEDHRARVTLLPHVVRVAQTLAFAHERGVVHRDVKPDNVVVGTHGEAFLLDWGIARVRGLGDFVGPEGSDAVVGHTMHGSVLGTPAYMAPEQAKGDIERIDERTDVFALGAMLFHVLTGKAPFTGASVAEVLSAARESKSQSLDELAPTAPAELRAIARKAMSVDPAQRHKTAGEFAQELEDFMAQAVAQPTSKGVERFIAATSWFGLVVCLALSAMIWQLTPSLREMGALAWVTLIFFVLGTAVGVVEWNSRGRHHLFSLGLWLAFATVASALAAASTGLLRVTEALADHQVAVNAEKFRGLAAAGFYEASGNIPMGLALAMLQGILLAIAWRASRVTVTKV